MKAIINSSELEKELKAIAPVIKKNHVIPITESVLMEFTKNSVKVTGTDLETTAIFILKCECQKAFDIVISFEKILDVCSKVSEPISIELKDTVIHISGENSNFRFPKMGELEHFPTTTDDELSMSVDVDCDFFYALSLASVCKHKDDLKINMNMPCIDFKKKMSATFVGLNDFYGFVKTIEYKPTKDLTIMIPDSFVQLTKTFQDSTIWASDKWIKAEYGDRIIISRLGESQYVNYNMIIPKELKYNFRSNKAQFKNALRIAGVAANVTTNLYVLNFKDNELIITSQDVLLGGDADTRISVSHSVEFESVCVNGGFLLNLLNLLDSDEIEMAFVNPTKTMYMRPVGDDTILTLIQPLTNN